MEDTQNSIKLVDEQLATYIELKSEALAQEDFIAANEYKEEIAKLQKQRDQLSRQLRKEAASMIESEIENMAQGVLTTKTSTETSSAQAEVPKKPLPVPPQKKNVLAESEFEHTQQITMDELDRQIEDILQMVAVPHQTNHKRFHPPENLPDTSSTKIEDATNFEELIHCLDVVWSDLDKVSRQRTKLEDQVSALLNFLEDMGEKIDATACS